MKKILSLLLILSAGLFLATTVARANVVFAGSPILVQGTTNLFVVPIVQTISLSQFNFTVGSATNPATVFNAAVCENIGGSTMLPLGSPFIYNFGTNALGGFTTNLPPASLTTTNYIYVVINSGTNTVSLQGQYGY